MEDFIHILTSLTHFAEEPDPTSADFLEVVIGPFVNVLIFIGMIVALMLPIFAIPYLFIKMGSVAGKMQAALQKTARRTAGGKNALGKAARGAAGREWERKAGQWAAKGDGSLKSKVGGYKTQRDFKRSQQSANAKRLQEEGLEKRIAGDPQYRTAAGGTYADTVAQGIRDKRLREHEDNAEALLRRDNIFAPKDLRTLGDGGVVGSIDTRDQSDEVAQAISRVAVRRSVAAQDSDNLNHFVSDQSTADKDMVYSEIQKQYSTAKGAGAHFVNFGKDGNFNGWDPNRLAQEAAEAYATLAPEKAVQQDGGTMKMVVQGFNNKQQQVQTLLATPNRSQAQENNLNELLNQMQVVKKKLDDIKANPTTYNAAKESVQQSMEDLHKIV